MNTIATPYKDRKTMVTLKTYATELAAETAVSCLEANGVRCVLTADDCGGMLSTLDNFSGVKLTVAGHDADSAREILSGEGVVGPAVLNRLALK